MSKEAEVKTPEYVFVRNINDIGATGIMDIQNQKLLCICAQDKADIILHALKNLSSPQEVTDEMIETNANADAVFYGSNNFQREHYKEGWKQGANYVRSKLNK